MEHTGWSECVVCGTQCILQTFTEQLLLQDLLDTKMSLYVPYPVDVCELLGKASNYNDLINFNTGWYNCHKPNCRV